MTRGIQTVMSPVSDVDRAKATLSALLGAEPAQDAPYDVAYQVNGQNIGLNPNGHAQGMPGPVAYVHVDDIEITRQALLDAGAEEVEPIHEVGDGRRITTLQDA